MSMYLSTFVVADTDIQCRLQMLTPISMALLYMMSHEDSKQHVLQISWNVTRVELDTPGWA